jgi:hypothetical protein
MLAAYPLKTKILPGQTVILAEWPGTVNLGRRVIDLDY